MNLPNGQEKLDLRGGRRAGSGRKKIGETRRISVTMPRDFWKKFDEQRDFNNKKNGEFLRDILVEYFNRDW